MARLLLAFLAAVALPGCASVSTIPLSKNTFQLTTQASPECSADQTQRIAFKRAAAETIKNGYDSFIVAGTEFRPESTFNVWNGSMSTLANQSLTVTMYRAGDPAASTALDARQILGPKWEEAVKEQTFNCFDV